jgi:hypothetical protein
MFNFSTNHLFLISRAEYPSCAVLLMLDRDTQRVYQLHDFSKSRSGSESLQVTETAMGMIGMMSEMGGHLSGCARPRALRMSASSSPMQPAAKSSTVVRSYSRVSKTPHGDLARFWNEPLGVAKYDSQQIKDRLRKGHPFRKGDGAAERSLEFWQSVYKGDLRGVFPEPFPLSPKLKERYRQPKERYRRNDH